MKHFFKAAKAFCLAYVFFSVFSMAAENASQEYLRILFYNTENYFDCRDDSLTKDDAFLPEGDYHWTPKRFRHKTHQLAKVLAVAGEQRFPDIFALAEIETEDNLKALLHEAGMTQHRYVYAESEDARGIDLCLAYHRYRLKYLDSRLHHLRFPQDSTKRTRPLLYVALQTERLDTLHIFVCHWPSKYGGNQATAPLRAHAADMLRRECDSLLKDNPWANILIMGDFNDEPQDASLAGHLQALPDTFARSAPGNLYNLMWTMSQENAIKTHCYQGDWAMLDQFVVSSSLYDKCLKANVFDADFLLQYDERYLQAKPFRTYLGFSYLGGFSDHLPIYVDIPLKP